MYRRVRPYNSTELAASGNKPEAIFNFTDEQTAVLTHPQTGQKKTFQFERI